MTLNETRRLDECLNNCVEKPRDAVAKIDPARLEQWLEYAKNQVWQPRRLRQLIRAAERKVKGRQ
jgi:hypothetical protein